MSRETDDFKAQEAAVAASYILTSAFWDPVSISKVKINTDAFIIFSLWLNVNFFFFFFLLRLRLLWMFPEVSLYIHRLYFPYYFNMHHRDWKGTFLATRKKDITLSTHKSDCRELMSFAWHVVFYMLNRCSGSSWIRGSNTSLVLESKNVNILRGGHVLQSGFWEKEILRVCVKAKLFIQHNPYTRQFQTFKTSEDVGNKL